MFRQVLGVIVLAGVAVSAQTVEAQEGFTLDYTDIGFTVGLGGIGDASLAIGLRAEKAFKQVADLGDGVIGIQIGGDYYSWSGGGFSWSYIPIGVTANYHFPLDNKKIDPFLGLGLGYSIISCDYDGPFGNDLCSNSALYFIGRAGGRYFFRDKMALYGDVGAGAATINIGLMFSF
jgi:hypothetical protein